MTNISIGGALASPLSCRQQNACDRLTMPGACWSQRTINAVVYASTGSYAAAVLFDEENAVVYDLGYGASANHRRPEDGQADYLARSASSCADRGRSRSSRRFRVHARCREARAEASRTHQDSRGGWLSVNGSPLNILRFSARQISQWDVKTVRIPDHRSDVGGYRRTIPRRSAGCSGAWGDS